MKDYNKFYHKIRLKSNPTNPSTRCSFVVNPSKLSLSYPESLTTPWISHCNRILALFFLMYFCAGRWSSFRLGIRAPFLYARNFCYLLFGSIGFAFRSQKLLATTPGFFGVIYA